MNEISNLELDPSRSGPVHRVYKDLEFNFWSRVLNIWKSDRAVPMQLDYAKTVVNEKIEFGSSDLL